MRSNFRYVSWTPRGESRYLHLPRLYSPPIILRALSRHCRRVRPNCLSNSYRSIEFRSQVAACIGIIGAVAFFILAHFGNTSWIVGLVFGWPVLAAMLFIAPFTLPHGLSCWREFWRFHERRYHITLRFLAPLYAALCALGLVSTAVLMLR